MILVPELAILFVEDDEYSGQSNTPFNLPLSSRKQPCRSVIGLFQFGLMYMYLFQEQFIIKGFEGDVAGTCPMIFKPV